MPSAMPFGHVLADTHGIQVLHELQDLLQVVDILMANLLPVLDGGNDLGKRM